MRWEGAGHMNGREGKFMQIILLNPEGKGQLGRPW
jgi:hypothetical protein